MWAVSEDNKNLLASWARESDNRAFKDKVDKWCKKSSLVLDLDELMVTLEPLADAFPIYRFIDNLYIHVPVVEKVIDPAYQARIQKLKWEQENKEYTEMTRSIDPGQNYGARNLMGTFGEELQSVNRQMIAVFNTLLTVGGAFSFGYFGLSYASPSLEISIATRMVIGLVLATIVFFADLYFIVKGMGDYEAPRKQKLPGSFERPKSQSYDPSQERNIKEADSTTESSTTGLKASAKKRVKKVKRLD